MRTAAMALGWELWARHRWGLRTLVMLALVAALLGQVLPAGPAVLMIGEIASLLLMFAYYYLLSICVYGENHLSGNAAGFPTRLFTLPVRTHVLVAWPMLYGASAAVLLWFWVTRLIMIPCGMTRTAEWWPALLLAALLTAFQAVCWTFVRSPLLRLVVAILGLPSLVMIGAYYAASHSLHVTEVELSWGMSALIGVSYLVAVAGVARTRRGDRLSWAWLREFAGRAVPRLPGGARAFTSPTAAQRWLEVRRNGWMLPVFVGFFLLMLFWATALPLSRDEVARVVAAIVFVPALLAFFVGFGMGKTSFWARDLQLTSFMATRPLSSMALANAKLYAAAISTLITFVLVLVLAPLWAVLTGNADVVRELCEGLVRDEPAWRLGILAPAVALGLSGLIWLQIVAGMCLSLTGRSWVVNTVVLFYVMVAAALIALGSWTNSHPAFFDTLLVVLGWLGGALFLLKAGAAAWIWRQPGLWREKAAVRLIALWLAIAACLVLVLYTVMPESPVPRILVALFVVLALPLTRLTALPAAIAWNRHR